MTTPKDFAIALLRRLNLPETTNNVISLVAFVGIEQGHWAPNLRGTHNPLNTTLRMPGSTSATGVGVQRYKSWADGIEANARTLSQSNMRGILNALKASVDPQAFLVALSDSAWCSNPKTIAQRGPDCTGDPNQGPCYCNYAKFSAKALYQNWANRSDGAITKPAEEGGGIAILFAIAVLLAVVWYKWGRSRS